MMQRFAAWGTVGQSKEADHETTMTGQTRKFFEALAERGHDPRLEDATGTLRVDVEDQHQVEYWFLTVEKGDVTVSRGDAEADAVIRADRKLFESMLAGEISPVVAFRRDSIVPRGNLGLIQAFQRVFMAAPLSPSMNGAVRFARTG